MRLTFSIAILSLAAWACQAQTKPNPSSWWVHSAVVAHAGSAALDGLSSWKQGEGNTLYADKIGPWTGHFYREGAGRMAAITGGIILVSEVVGIVKPKWRKYVAAFNFVGAAVHVGVTTSNVVRNPYYRN